MKTIDTIATDGNEYRFLFFQLTNDTDILVSQYRRIPQGKWELINIDANQCISDKK